MVVQCCRTAAPLTKMENSVSLTAWTRQLRRTLPIGGYSKVNFRYRFSLSKANFRCQCFEVNPCLFLSKGANKSASAPNADAGLAAQKSPTWNRWGSGPEESKRVEGPRTPASRLGVQGSASRDYRIRVQGSVSRDYRIIV